MTPSATPSRSTVDRRPGRVGTAEVSTIVLPDAVAECTPVPGDSSTGRVASVRYTRTSVGSSAEAVNNTSVRLPRPLVVPTTARTCSSPEAIRSPTNNRRRPSASPTRTSSPSGDHAGTPSTSSTQTGSVSVCSTPVAPVIGSMVSVCTRSWSRLCTDSSGGPNRDQCTAHRYSKASVSQCAATGVPTCSGSTYSATSALVVPAAG